MPVAEAPGPNGSDFFLITYELKPETLALILWLFVGVIVVEAVGGF